MWARTAVLFLLVTQGLSATVNHVIPNDGGPIKVSDLLRSDDGDVLQRRRRSSVETFPIQIDSSIEVLGGVSDVNAALDTLSSEMLLDVQNNKLWERITDGSGTHLVEHAKPCDLQVEMAIEAEEYLPFSDPPVVKLLDCSGNVITTFGNTWSVNVTLTVDPHGAIHAIESIEWEVLGDLLGSSTKQFSNGAAEFSDLAVTHLGWHLLTFQIVSPSIHVSVQNADVVVQILQRTVAVAVTSSQPMLGHGAHVDLGLQLRNSIGGVLENPGFRGHTYSATVTLDTTTDIGDAAISGTNTANFNHASASISGMRISNTVDYHKYNLIINVATNPQLLSAAQYHTVQFYNPSSSLHTAATSATVKFLLSGIVDRQARITSQISSNSFETFMNNHLTDIVNGDAYIGTIVIETVNSNTEVRVIVNSLDQTNLDQSIAAMRAAFSTSALTYNGQSYTNADVTCVIESDGVCQSSTVVSASSTGLDTGAIIGICLAVTIVMGVVIVGVMCFYKRENKYLRDSRPQRGPLACVAGTGSVSTIGTNLVRISPGLSRPEFHINDGFDTYETLPSRGPSAASTVTSTTIHNLPKIDV